MRAIDADALRDRLQNLGYDDWNQGVTTTWAEAFNECADMVDEQPTIEPQQRWIPCSERLPNRDEYIKNNGLFNVSDGNRSYSEWFDVYDKQRFGEPTMYGFRIDYAVIAWMPLPEPYREGAQE